jgi:type III restriction-modification system methyltransferase subunit
MIKKQLEKNENVKPNTKLLNQLKENFPDFFDKDNNFKIDKFKNALKSDEINITKEGYELNFLGKSYARFQTSTETETIISPLTDHNNKDENINSENLYIIGDNLDALKHLLKSYSRKVKCIYIDPPYNTGSDGFVYPDNFKFDSATLSNKMGIDEDEAERIIDMRGKSTHSAWLTFMYPRLVLARELLSDDGVIFISIDDNEHANLKLICDEIFGEENFINNFTWLNNLTGRQISGIGAAKTNEPILVYSKSKDSASTFNIDITFAKKYMPDAYKGFNFTIEEDNYGKYKKGDTLYNHNRKFNEETRRNLVYSIYYDEINNSFHPENPDLDKTNLIEILPHKNNDGIHKFHAWRWSKEKVINEQYNLIAEKKSNGEYEIYTKNRNYNQTTLKDIITNISNGDNEISSLFETKVFEYPKSTLLLSTLLGTMDNSLVLDFFSGSATTAHSVMKLNAEDGGNRKYILVQLPEEIEESKPAFKAGYKTIDEIGRERIKRAAQKIKEETNADIDYGFKVVKLENVQENTLERLESFDPNVLVSDDYVNDFSNEDSSGLETILTTWLNQDGYGLHAKWKDFKLVNYIAHRYSNTLYIVNEGIESSDISLLIEMIENNELNISRIVIYTYSLPFTIINELKTNIKNLRNNKTVDIIERY